MGEVIIGDGQITLHGEVEARLAELAEAWGLSLDDAFRRVIYERLVERGLEVPPGLWDGHSP